VDDADARDHHIRHKLAQDEDDEEAPLFGRELKPLRTTNVKVSSAVRTGGTTGRTVNKPQRATKPKLPKTYGKTVPYVLPQTPTLGPTEKPPTSVLFDALSINEKYLTCLQYYSDAAPQQGGKGGGSTKGGNDSKGTSTGGGLSSGKGGKAGGSTKASPDLVAGVTKVNNYSYEKNVCVRILNNQFTCCFLLFTIGCMSSTFSGLIDWWCKYQTCENLIIVSLASTQLNLIYNISF
jgi:hypothetical protein